MINDCLVVPLPVTQEVIPGSPKLSKEFILKVLSTLRNDELEPYAEKMSLFFTLVQNYFQRDHTKQKKWLLF